MLTFWSTGRLYENLFCVEVSFLRSCVSYLDLEVLLIHMLSTVRSVEASTVDLLLP